MTITATAMLTETPEVIMAIEMPALQWVKEREKASSLIQKALEMPFPKSGMRTN